MKVLFKILLTNSSASADSVCFCTMCKYSTICEETSRRQDVATTEVVIVGLSGWMAELCGGASLHLYSDSQAWQRVSR
ncbi:MAG: hypothetical protein IKD16_06215 [Bacteroidales bacterium]|nr:hypothetical protein [Bacteroidales bacterium]